MLSDHIARRNDESWVTAINSNLSGFNVRCINVQRNVNVTITHKKLVVRRNTTEDSLAASKSDGTLEL